MVITSYKKTTQAEANRTVISRNKIGENDSSKTHSTKDESADKRRKLYVDQSKRASKNCMIHGLGHSSDGCKVLG